MRFDIYRENHSELTAIVQLLVRAALVRFGQQLRAHNCPLYRKDLLYQLYLVVFFH